MRAFLQNGQMKPFSYHTSDVLICDPIGANLASTRATLLTIGFQKIVSVSPQDFGGALAAGSFDLAICECQGIENELFRAIKALRRGDIGRNPFLVLIVTSWVESSLLIRRAIDSGADDFLLRPTSAEVLCQSIAALIEHRRAFIIRRDYIGPARESDQNSQLAKPFFPPNTLRLKAKDRLGPEATNFHLARELRLARHRLETRLLWCDAFQICVRLKLAADYAPASPKQVGNFNKVMALTKAVEMRVEKTRSETVIKYCQRAISEIVALSKITTNTDAKSLGRAAWSLYHCVDPAQSFEEYCSELAAIATRVRDKERGESAGLCKE